MTARFDDSRTYAAPKERVFPACIKALQRAKLKITESDQHSGSISAVSSDSQYSSRPDSGFFEEVGLIVATLTGLQSKFKERISVVIGDDGCVHAFSVSEPHTVILDQGRNRQHVLKFFDALDAALGHGAADTENYTDMAACASGVTSGHAFISYVREDTSEVDALQRALEAAGVKVWRDTSELWPGDDWRVKIRAAITCNALAFIACFSRNSIARQSTYQNEELAVAIDQLRTRRPDLPWLIPVRFDDCAIPALDVGLGRTLATFQRADVFGEGRDEATARLIHAVERILAPAREVPAASASS